MLAGTWGNVAYALYEQAWLLQPLSVFGIFGAELFILVINFALAYAAHRGDSTASGRRARCQPFEMRRGAAHAWHRRVVLRPWLGLAVAASCSNHSRERSRVATVQSNAPIDAEEELQRVMAATRELGAKGAKVVVWREGGLKFDPLRERTDMLKALAAETRRLSRGRLRRQGGERSAAQRSSRVRADGRDRIGPYGKSHPGRFAGDHSDTGGTYKVYDTALGRIATIICYDLDFTDTAREMARRGAQFIAVPSNDVPAIATTHYTHLVFRAIENRLPLAKADSLFDTAIIDPMGASWRATSTTSTWPKPKRSPRRAACRRRRSSPTCRSEHGDTIAVRFGDWIGWLAIVLAAAMALATRRLRCARLSRR